MLLVTYKVHSSQPAYLWVHKLVRPSLDTANMVHTLIMVSYVCFLSSGLNVLLSGGVDNFEIASSAYPLLIPAFVSTLILHQPPYPFPPDPQVYVGEYALEVIGISFTVTEYKNQLRLTSQGMTGFLAYREPLMFQVGFCYIICEHKDFTKLPIYSQLLACMPYNCQVTGSI